MYVDAQLGKQGGKFGYQLATTTYQTCVDTVFTALEDMN